MSSYGLYLAAAGMKVSDHQQAIHANNLANANTTGFKQDLALVLERKIESESSPSGQAYAHPVLDGLGGGVNVRPSRHNFAQGSLERTERPLDVAISGKGFFEVSDGKETRYTRDGVFTISAAGELVMSAGGGRWKVQSDAGTPIAIDSSAGPVRISGDGTIRQGEEVVSKLGIRSADNLTALRKVGENLFDGSDTKMKSIDGLFVSGARESSNYDAISGLASMILASRQYQMNATMVQMQDDLDGQAISTVGRLR